MKGSVMVYVIVGLIVIFLFKNTIFLILFAPVEKLFFNLKKNKKRVPRNNLEINTLPQISQKVDLKANLKDLYYSFTSYYLYRVSQTPSHHVRNFIYRHVCSMKLADKAIVYFGAEIREPQNIEIGKGSVIGDKSILDGRNGIIIGENVVFASNVSIWTEQHDHRDPWFRVETQQKNPVIIGNRAWIGPNSIILHSVHIGEGAVVAAGAVVTHDVEPFTIVAGIPAKRIGERNHDLRYEMDGSHRHFL